MRTVDRNFRVVLRERQTGAERVIFKSFDQSPTITRERFVWSADSSKVALVGDRYYVAPDPNARLPDGDIVFLVYDLQADKLWCNSEYDRGFDRIAATGAADLVNGLNAGIPSRSRP